MTSLNCSRPGWVYCVPLSSCSVAFASAGPLFTSVPCRISQFQRQQLAARLRDVDIDGIERLDRGERRRLLGGDQRALRHGGAADAAGDRRGDARVIEIDARAFGVGERLLVGGARVVIVLRRYRGLLQKRRKARRLRLRADENGGGVVIGRLIWRGIDLIERLALMDGCPFGKQPRLQEPADLRPDIGDRVGIGATGKDGRQQRRLGFDDDDAHIRWWPVMLLALPASGEPQRTQRQKQRLFA